MFPPPQAVLRSLATVQDTKTGCCQAFLLRPTTFDGRRGILWEASRAGLQPFRREEADSQKPTSGHASYMLDLQYYSSS